MFHLRVQSFALLVAWGLLLFSSTGARFNALAGEGPTTGLASWYGEEHRGKLMANGKRFDPDKLTAASWFYPLGTKVRVSLASTSEPRASVVVTITDRGPDKHLVRDGRIIDLSHASFERLGAPEVGLLEVKVAPVEPHSKASTSTAQTKSGNDALPLPQVSLSTGLRSSNLLAAVGTAPR
jgi:rare lipoprotein A